AASTALANVTIDTTAPTVTITSNLLTSGGTFSATTNTRFSITSSENLYGLVEADLIKSGSNWVWNNYYYAGSTASNVYYYAYSNGSSTNGGIISLQVPSGVATDLAGNDNSASNTFTTNWTATITFNANGGTGTAPVAMTQSSSTASVALPSGSTLTKTGYRLNGWATTTTGTAVSSPYTPTANITLYAVWTAATYTITYNTNGATGSQANSSDSWTYNGSAVTLSAVGTMVKTGYTFAGWNTSSSATTAISNTYAATNSSNVTLYAVWTANTYAVTFNGNSSTSGTMSNMSIVAGTAKALTTNAFSRTGYTFAGWNTVADGSGTNYANLASVTVYGNLTVYAKWTVLAPGAPTAISSTAGNGQATVSATTQAASSTLGAASSVTIYAYSGATLIGSCTYSTPGSTSCVITGLTNGTAYTLKATATNATGTSAVYTGGTVTSSGYVVTYNANYSGGTVTPSTATYNSGVPLTLPLPVRSGYSFLGWYTESGTTNFVGSDGSNYSPSGAITLYAKWEGITYAISYNGNGATGGSAPSNGTYQTGGTSYSVTANAGTLTKTGYTFSAWHDNPSGTGSAITSYSTSADKTLYAKWTPNTYTITYNSNSGSGTAMRATDSFTVGDSAVTLPGSNGFSRSGYTFMGWLASQSDTTTVTSPYVPSASITLYAYWLGDTYSINYDESGATGSVTDVSFRVGESGLTLPSGSGLSRTGYTFGGWAVNGTPISNGYTPSGNVTITAIWTPVTRNINYNINITPDSALSNNPTSSPTSGTYGSNVNISSIDTSTVASGITNIFAGWNTLQNGTGTSYAAGASYTVGTSDITLYAQWVKIYEVKYVLNGGALAAGEFTYDAECTNSGNQCNNNQTIILNASPTRAGYTFQHWSVTNGGSAVSNSNAHVVTDGTYILYAVWSPKTYAVAFDKGASGASGTATTISGGYGALGTLAQSSGFSYTGFKFTGWQISGQSSTYSAGASYLFGTDAESVTMVAQWANNNFTIYFDTNGGTATGSNSVSGDASATVNLPSAPTRSGYVFAGWSTGATTLSASATTTSMGSSNSTYIANWTLAAPAVPTISSVTAGNGSAMIQISAGAGGGTPSSYTITASPGGGTCTVVSPATNCSIAPLTNGTAYTFTATATNSTGTSSASSASSSVTPAGNPGAPTALVGSIGNGQASVSLTAPTDNGGAAIQSYTITSSPDGKTCTVSAPNTSCTVTGLTNGTAYTFTATANNGVGTSTNSAPSASVTPATTPSAPTIGDVTSSASGTASVPFTAGSNGGSAITSYTVTATPTGGGSAITASGSSSPISVSGLTDGVQYTYSLVATNSIGNSSASGTDTLVTQGPATAPTSVSAVASDSSATITFSGASTNGSTINSYTVTAYDFSGNATTDTCTVSSSLTTALSCTINGLTNGSIYTFKVTTNSTSNGTSGNSSASVASNQSTPAAKPNAPTINTPTPGDNKITVSWSLNATNGSTVTGYVVTAYNSAGTAISPAKTCTSNDIATTSCDITGLAVGTEYKFKVVALASPADSDPSSFSALESMNSVPSQPDAPTVTTGNASASVAVTAPATNGYAITGYTVTATPVGGGTAVTA
ncbi:MAG: hypothetical protein EBU16_04625, partial [Actinobacteria bacterium]|nr:hypothetical protein [Actinomycetota bacterium]